MGKFLQPLAAKYRCRKRNKGKSIAEGLETLDEELQGYMSDRLARRVGHNPQKQTLEASTDVALTYFSSLRPEAQLMGIKGEGNYFVRKTCVYYGLAKFLLILAKLLSSLSANAIFTILYLS